MNQLWTQRLTRCGLALLVAGMVGVLAVAVWQLPAESRGLFAAVEARLDETGVSNPVTAVLLNFRAYDTLLELVVLLLAAIGGQMLAGSEAGRAATERQAGRDEAGRADDTVPEQALSPVLQGFVRMVAPVMIVIAGYVLWVGGHAPGGAFQAGAVLAAAGVLLRHSGGARRRSRGRESMQRFAGRWVLVAGLLVFLGVGIGTLIARRQFLEYPAVGTKSLVLLIEAAAMISIAATLLALFRGGQLDGEGQLDSGGQAGDGESHPAPPREATGEGNDCGDDNHPLERMP